MDHAKHQEHSGGHAGHHMPTITKDNIKALKITTWLTGVYFFIELGIGIYTSSIAVISDAFHTFSAVGGVLLALIAGRIAMKPANRFRTFGFMRAEIMGALFNGFFLVIMAFIVLWMGYKRLLNPIHLPTTPMLLAAFGGLITEFIAIKLLYGAQKGNLNIKGAFWHVMQTFVGSIIIIITALVIRFTGFLAIDPILGMLFGVTLIYASWGIIKESLNILLETVPKEIDLDKVKKSLTEIEDVIDIHHIHAWAITSGKNIFSTHIRVNSLDRYNQIMK
nr:cation diffusion facilitator family transporter [Hydrotalea flava]NIO94581.1 cation diffusion facilitator family transporter [Hydrotalea flava]